MNEIIKLAVVALIGYGVYKAFFAEDNDVGVAATAANSGSGTQSRGSTSYYSSTAANSGSGTQSRGSTSYYSSTAANSGSTSQQSGYKPASVLFQQATDTSYLDRHLLRKEINKILP